MKKYSVWVGGIEVNDYLMTYNEAKKIKSMYLNLGYDDIIIQKY